ncbi:unnamed protein product [Closterium sp. Naga37s-1]|nr:unnamed protein product [Closterium sp. Naga37s-1]
MPPPAAICFPLPHPRTPGAASPGAFLPAATDLPKFDRSLHDSHFDVTLKSVYPPAPHSACALCFGEGGPRRGAKEPRPRRSAQYGGVRRGTLRARPGDLRTPLARVAGDEGGAARAGQAEGTAGGAAGAPDARVARVMRVLREDLPVQYERDLDWSIYDASVAFVDPVPPDACTRSPFSPRPGLEGRVGEAVSAVRSVWSTRGQTRWGKALSITGDDVFRVNSTGKIITHESHMRLSGKTGKGSEGAVDVQKQAFTWHAATNKHKLAIQRQDQLVGATRQPRIDEHPLAHDSEKVRVISLLDALLFVSKEDAPMELWVGLVRYLAERGVPGFPKKGYGTYYTT